MSDSFSRTNDTRGRRSFLKKSLAAGVAGATTRGSSQQPTRRRRFGTRVILLRPAICGDGVVRHKGLAAIASQARRHDCPRASSTGEVAALPLFRPLEREVVLMIACATRSRGAHATPVQ